MLARIAVHLPESLWLREDAQLEPFTATLNGEQLVVHPPLQCGFEIRPDADGTFEINDIYRLLTPVATAKTYPYVRMDGQFVKHANLLQVDIVGRDFSRDAGAMPDPSDAFVEQVVMNVVGRLRYVVGAPSVREFRLIDTFWTTRYLADDGSDLSADKGLVRGHVRAPFKFRFTGLSKSSWERVKSLSFSFQPWIWERAFISTL